MAGLTKPIASKRFRYSVYGLSISSDRPIVGLRSQAADGPSDVRVEHCGAVESFPAAPDVLLLHGTKASLDQFHTLRVWRDEDRLHVRYQLKDQHVDFVIASAADSIDITWSSHFPVDDIPAFLLGPVIGCVLRLRGVMTLHAGVVHVGDTAIAILADKGGGKSTLVSAMAQQGFPILSDDVAVIEERDGQFWVHPGYPRLRLWPETLRWLGEFRSDLPRVESIFDKRYLDLTSDSSARQWRFGSEPRRLRAAFVLNARRAGAECRVAPMPAAASLTALLRNGYADYVLDHAGRTDLFSRLARLANHLAVFTVDRPDDLARVPDTFDALMSH